MATQPPDPHPDSPPRERPPHSPDEIVPDQGDVDHPDSIPAEQPGIPVVSPERESRNGFPPPLVSPRPAM